MDWPAYGFQLLGPVASKRTGAIGETVVSDLAPSEKWGIGTKKQHGFFS